MCHVLVVYFSEKFSAKQKREFEEETRAKIRQHKTNASINFIYGDEQLWKIKRKIQRYKKKHPHAEIKRDEKPVKMAMAS
jgi:hypothetical protein